MIVFHDFKISIKEYISLGKNNSFPQMFICPHCGDRLIKNGFYKRYLITRFNTYRLLIRRLRCKHCGISISILPNFVLPGFQRSSTFIYQILKEYLISKNKIIYNKALYFYQHRFMKNISIIFSFFRMTKSFFLKIPPSKKAKAIKLIHLIDQLSIHTFSQRFFNRLNITFMAH